MTKTDYDKPVSFLTPTQNRIETICDLLKQFSSDDIMQAVASLIEQRRRYSKATLNQLHPGDGVAYDTVLREYINLITISQMLGEYCNG